MNELKPKVNIDARYRTMLILWFALMMSVGMYVFTAVVLKQRLEDTVPQDNRMLSFILAAVGTFSAVVSFPVRSKLLQRSVENQDPGLVQKALVAGCALCEVPALLAILALVILPGRDYLLLFAISIITMALHFPRRSNLLAASYKNPSFESRLNN